MTLRKSIAAFALTAGLVGVTSEAQAQITVSPGLGGVTVGGQRSGAGMFIPYGGGGVQFTHPSVGAWNYSNGAISPAFGNFSTPYGNPGFNNFGYGSYANNGFYSPYSDFGGQYGSNFTPYANRGNPYGGYNSFYTPYGNTVGGWGYPSGSYYYGNPGRGMYRR